MSYSALKRYLHGLTALRPLFLLRNRLTAHGAILLFLARVVAPLAVRTRKRPVLFFRYMAMGDVLCTFPAALELKKRHAGAAFIYCSRRDFHVLVRMAGVTTHVVEPMDIHILSGFYAFAFAAIYSFTYGDETDNSISTEAITAEFCRQHAVPVTAEHTRLTSNPQSLSRVQSFLDTNDFRGGPIIAFHTGPTAPCREWPLESWITLADELIRHGCTKIIQLGSSRRGDLLEVPAVLIPNALPAINRFSMEESVALISLCDLVIGIDSGLLHVAVSVETAALGIFGSTSPRLRFSTEEARPFVVSRIKCQGCHHRRPRLHWVTGCPFDLQCMKIIQVGEVLQAALALLATDTKRREASERTTLR